jgi:hypothetical protein
MSRRGNGYDPALTESFLSLLKTERNKRKIDKVRAEVGPESYDRIWCLNI